MSEQATVQDPFAVSPQEGAIAYSGPAPAVNRFVVAPLSHGYRVSFLESSFHGDVFFRSAIFMSHQDTAQLYALLGRMLHPTEPPNV